MSQQSFFLIPRLRLAPSSHRAEPRELGPRPTHLFRLFRGRSSENFLTTLFDGTPRETSSKDAILFVYSSSSVIPLIPMTQGRKNWDPELIIFFSFSEIHANPFFREKTDSFPMPFDGTSRESLSNDAHGLYYSSPLVNPMLPSRRGEEIITLTYQFFFSSSEIH